MFRRNELIIINYIKYNTLNLFGGYGKKGSKLKNNKKDSIKKSFRYFFLIAIFFLPYTNSIYSEPISLPKQGITSNILWPIYPGGKFRFSYRREINSHDKWRTDLLLGISHSLPDNRPTEGIFSETSGILGIRQFLASPWHIDFQVVHGRGSLASAVAPGFLNQRTLLLAATDSNLLVYDEILRTKNYSSIDTELLGLVGYEWKLSEQWSIDLQAGMGKLVSKSNPWPVYADSNRTKTIGESLIPMVTINLTYWF